MHSTHGLNAWDWQDVKSAIFVKRNLFKKSVKKHLEYQVCLLKTIGEKKYLCREKECKMKYTTAEETILYFLCQNFISSANQVPTGVQ